jgi:cobalt/nickel transport system ATP-binding protein
VSRIAIEVAGVSYRYPDGKRALDEVSISVDEGERVAVLGPNGAGKTTLAMHLNGLYRAESGTIEISGLRLENRTLPEIRRRVGLVFQDSNDQLFMPTVRDDVGFGPANLGLEGPELQNRVDSAMDSVGVRSLAGRAPHHLSSGEKRKVAIATVLAMDPEVLVLDEPSAGLDPANRRELIDLLAGVEITQLVITHDLPLALDLCPRAVIMDAGRVVAAGATGDLLADTQLLAGHRLEMPYPMAD